MFRRALRLDSGSKGKRVVISEEHLPLSQELGSRVRELVMRRAMVPSFHVLVSHVEVRLSVSHLQRKLKTAALG